MYIESADVVYNFTLLLSIKFLLGMFILAPVLARLEMRGLLAKGLELGVQTSGEGAQAKTFHYSTQINRQDNYFH